MALDVALDVALASIPSGPGLGIGAGLLPLSLHSQFSIPTLDDKGILKLAHFHLLSNSVALFARPTGGNGTY